MINVTAVVANALPNLTAALRTQITNDIRNGVGPSGGGGGDAIIISTLMKNHMLRGHEYVNCPIRFDDRIRPANLLPIHMFDFDVILGMDWLASHQATID
ncbi:reverse transcriptase domain-containing protein, partial [Tanacetum coccineum]